VPLSIATYFQTATSATSTILIPGRQKVVGVSLSGAADGSVAPSTILLQASIAGVLQNNSTGMPGVLAQLVYFSALSASFPSQSQYFAVPGIVVNDKVFLHGSVSSGMTAFFSAVFYFE